MMGATLTTVKKGDYTKIVRVIKVIKDGGAHGNDQDQGSSINSAITIYQQ